MIASFLGLRMTRSTPHSKPCAVSGLGVVEKFSETVIQRKREKNKAVAKKARQKAKSLLLQRKADLSALQEENSELKRLPAAPVIALERILSTPADPPEIIQELLRPFQTERDVAYTVSSTFRQGDEIVFASPGFCQLAGLPAAQIYGRPIHSFLGCSKEEVYTSASVAVIASDGARRNCGLHVAPVRDLTGKTFLLLAVFIPA